jgi:hypothetical protein
MVKCGQSPQSSLDVGLVGNKSALVKTDIDLMKIDSIFS